MKRIYIALAILSSLYCFLRIFQPQYAGLINGLQAGVFIILGQGLFAIKAKPSAYIYWIRIVALAVVLVLAFYYEFYVDLNLKTDPLRVADSFLLMDIVLAIPIAINAILNITAKRNLTLEQDEELV